MVITILLPPALRNWPGDGVRNAVAANLGLSFELVGNLVPNVGFSVSGSHLPTVPTTVISKRRKQRAPLYPLANIAKKWGTGSTLRIEGVPDVSIEPVLSDRAARDTPRWSWRDDDWRFSLLALLAPKEPPNPWGKLEYMSDDDYCTYWNPC
jgi:hypothetical protein